MTHAPIDDYVNMIGGAAVLALGVFAWAVRPRTRASLAFATFALGFGAYYVLANLLGNIVHVTPEAKLWALVPARLAAVVGIVATALVFPAPVSRRERPWLVAAAAVTLSLSLANLYALIAVRGLESLAALTEAVVGAAATPSLYGFLLLLAGRFVSSRDGDFRRHAGLTAAALILFIGYHAGHGGSNDGSSSVVRASGVALSYTWARIALLVAIAGIWLAGTRGPEGRLARRLAWLTLATALVGLLLAAAGTGGGGYGVARLLMTAVLAYAVLKHQLLGVEVKLRWTISKSTVAAAFVAAFFVASEGAQLLFGAGNEWVGLAAAGALVFAIAPLQRAAERLAEKAVPVVGATAQDPAAALPGSAKDRYRVLLRRFLKDGRISRDEEVALAHAAASMGLRADEIVSLRHDVEDELASAEGTAR